MSKFEAFFNTVFDLLCFSKFGHNFFLKNFQAYFERKIAGEVLLSNKFENAAGATTCASAVDFPAHAGGEFATAPLSKP